MANMFWAGSVELGTTFQKCGIISIEKKMAGIEQEKFLENVLDWSEMHKNDLYHSKNIAFHQIDISTCIVQVIGNYLR